MGLLRRLLGGTSKTTASKPGGPPSWMKDGMEVTVLDGGDSLEVRGESYHQDELRFIVENIGREVPAILVPEPQNPHDSNAVAVWVAGLLVGHLPRELAPTFQPAAQRLMKEEGQPIALMGRIVGGDQGRPSF